MTRDSINKEVLKLSHNHNILALEWATGVGKSKAALDIVSEHKFKNDYKILLVVAELAHIKNWENEIITWNYKKLYQDNIQVTTYASLKHYSDKYWDFIILDEAHHIGSELRLEILDNLKYDRLLLLSATLDLETINSISFNLSEKMYIHTVTLNEAIKSSILPKPKIVLIPLTLSNRGDTEVFIEEWGTKSKRRRFTSTYSGRWEYLKNRRKYPHVSLEVKCTPRQKYMMINEKIEYFKKRTFITNSEGLRFKWMQYALLRKKFLGEMKTNIVKKLLGDLENKRYICFCTSIEQANLLGGSNAIHSKMEDPQQIIDDFNNKKINNIFAVGMIKEGQNLVDIDAGVIIQLDGKLRPFIQKFGRSLRSKYPTQYIFYYTNTRDEEYLDNILDEIDNKYIHKDENFNR